MSTITVDPTTDLDALLHDLTDGGEVRVQADGVVVARVLPLGQRPPYVGLYGNHPFDLAARHQVELPHLSPDDFED